MENFCKLFTNYWKYDIMNIRKDDIYEKDFRKQ